MHLCISAIFLFSFLIFFPLLHLPAFLVNAISPRPHGGLTFLLSQRSTEGGGLPNRRCNLTQTSCCHLDLLIFLKRQSCLQLQWRPYAYCTLDCFCGISFSMLLPCSPLPAGFYSFSCLISFSAPHCPEMWRGGEECHRVPVPLHIPP